MSQVRRQNLPCVADFSICPIGGAAKVPDTSCAKEIAECKKVLEKSGLKHNMHAMGTNIEGDWEEIMNVVRECQDRVHTMGKYYDSHRNCGHDHQHFQYFVGRDKIETIIRIESRHDKVPTIDDRVHLSSAEEDQRVKEP
ncbi:hypothetical protein HDV05_007254 [Chytridiales sp. JEL 0842]|nr:hypothetical protein HDV05_007254 [Chytridiales sp. JEL 0842]